MARILAYVIDGTTGNAGLRAEVADVVMSITPGVQGGEQFKYHKHTEATPLREMTGRVRLFGVGDFMPELTSIGSATHRSRLLFNVTIGYRHGEWWHTAALDDYWKIVEAMLTDQTFSTDVASRFVDVPAGPTFDVVDDWQWLVIPCRAIVDHT